MTPEPDDPIRILYNNVASDEIYELMQKVCPPGIDLVFLQHDDDSERKRKIKDCRGVMVAATPLRPSVMEEAGLLEIVQHQGVGYHDTVDTDLLRRRGIRLALTSSESASEAVAEHAVLLALAVIRRLLDAEQAFRSGNWYRNGVRARAQSLAGKTIGYMGMGRIGKAAAARFASFSTSGLYFDPHVRLPKHEEAALNLVRGSFTQVIGQADVVTLHLPLTKATRKLLGRDQFRCMKEGAIIVNTARGGLVDEDALAEALTGGRLGGAGLDVFETEPLSNESTLRTLPNVVMTPHVSAATRDVFRDKMQRALQNVHNHFYGSALTDEVQLDG